MWKHLRLTRATVLLMAGLALAFNEAVLEPKPRPELLLLAAGLMGLELPLRKDGK